MGSFWLASRLLLHLNYNSFLSLQPISLHHQILASPSLCKHRSQVLEKSLLYVTTSYWFSSSGECGVLQEVQSYLAVHSLFFFQTHHLIGLMNLSPSLNNQGIQRNRAVIAFSRFSPGLGECESIRRAECACSQLLERHRPSLIFLTVNSLMLIFPILIFVYIYLLPD